jgi:hypothetical protein
MHMIVSLNATYHEEYHLHSNRCGNLKSYMTYPTEVESLCATYFDINTSVYGKVIRNFSVTKLCKVT